MTEQSRSIRGDVNGIVRQYDYENETVLVADFGHVDGSVDVVDGTAIVVLGEEDDHYEFEVPEGASRGIMNNGIVSIEVEE